MKQRWIVCATAIALIFTSSAFGEEKLHSWVSQSLKKITPALEKADNLATQGDIANAKVYLESAQKEWDMIHKDLRDKFDDNHSEIVAVQKQLDSVTTKVYGADTAKNKAPEKPTAQPQEKPKKLDAMVAHSLKKIPPALDKAERLVNNNDMANAKVYFDKAQNEWDMIHIDFKGKFDENDPDIVAVRKQLEAVQAKMEMGTTLDEKPAAETATADGPAITDPLPSTMIYEMKQLNAGADWTLENVETMNIKEARKYLERENPWEIKKEWNKGKFHPQNPDVLALDAKIAEARKLVAARVARADDTEKNLAGVLATIQQNAKRLEEARENAKWKVRGISSAMSDGDGEKLLAEMEKARGPVERVNALLPESREAVTDFRKQFPDMKALDNLIENGYEVKVAVEKVEGFPAEWLDEMDREVQSALVEAEANIKMYGLDRLSQIEGSDEAMQTHAADSAEEHVLIFSNILLETIDVLLPELPESDKTVLPEFVTARKNALESAAPLRANIAKVEGAVRKVRKDIVDTEHRKLAGARFPKSEYHGGKWDDAEKVIRKAWAAAITDKKLLKIDIYRPWEVREEARWRNDHWVVNTYRYISANCLAKLPDGKYRVYRMTFRNTKQGGNWSELAHWSVGHSYEILEENAGL